MSISTHFVTKITARATPSKEGNWLEINFENKFGEVTSLTVYLYRCNEDNAGYANALALAINSVPPPVEQPLEDEVPY